MIIDGWTILKDARGFYAYDPRGPSWFRVSAGGYEMHSHDGGCFVPNKVMGTLESLVRCTCNPLEQTGGVHRRDCPEYEAAGREELR